MKKVKINVNVKVKRRAEIKVPGEQNFPEWLNELFDNWMKAIFTPIIW